MSFGKATMHKWTLDAEATEEIVAHALELGINFFDTANCYSEGTSEAYLGRLLKQNQTLWCSFALITPARKVFLSGICNEK